MENREEYNRLREESDNTELLRRMVANMNGEICANCGGKECIEYHHIVPLALGGTNRLTNYVALCHRCHMAAHYGRKITDYRNKKVSGRPHKVDDETMNEAFKLYLLGKIGASECKNMLNMSKKCKIADMSAFKAYKRERGIKSHRNNIDIIRKRRGYIKPGQTSGYIEYTDGTIESLTYEEYMM